MNTNETHKRRGGMGAGRKSSLLREMRRPAWEWVQRINKLAPCLRAGVGSIVWWDFADAADNPPEFTAVFEPLLEAGAGRAVSAQACEAALVELGYPPVMARWRAADRRTSSWPVRARPARMTKSF